MFRPSRAGAILTTSISIFSLLLLPEVLNAQPSRSGDRTGQQPERLERGRRSGFGGPMGNMNQIFEPSVSSADIDNWSKRLTFTSDQREAIDALLDAYQTQFNDAASAARDHIESLRDEARQSQDPSMFRDIMEERLAFQSQREQMEKAFFDDVKSVLNEKQLSEWPKIERDRRRDQTLDRGLIAGERVDVARFVEDLELPAKTLADLQPLLEQYKEDLDRDLIVRNKVYDQAQAKMRDFFSGSQDEDLDKLIKEGREVGIRIRDINRKYARQVEPMLPDDAKVKFAKRIQAESYPMVYRQTQGARTVEAAAKLDDLTPDQSAAIASIKDQYDRDIAALHARMEKAIDEEQANFTISGMRQRGFGMMMQGPMADLDKERRDLDDAVISKIKATLTPEQIEKLPAGRRSDQNDDAQPSSRRPRGDGGNDTDDQRPRRRDREGAR